MEPARARRGAAAREGSPPSGSGHSCRVVGVALALAASVTFMGCQTTHELGRLDDPGEMQRLQRIAARGRVYAVLDAPVIATDLGAPGRPVFALPPRHRVAAISREGVQLALRPPSATLVPGARIRYIATRDRLRGARDGALVLGIPYFLVATAATYAFVDRVENGLVIGAVVGLIAAGVGAGLGAFVGHEDRYVPVPSSRLEVW